MSEYFIQLYFILYGVHTYIRVSYNMMSEYFIQLYFILYSVRTYVHRLYNKSYIIYLITILTYTGTCAYIVIVQCTKPHL